MEFTIKLFNKNKRIKELEEKLELKNEMIEVLRNIEKVSNELYVFNSISIKKKNKKIQELEDELIWAYKKIDELDKKHINSLIQLGECQNSKNNNQNNTQQKSPARSEA